MVLSVNKKDYSVTSIFTYSGLKCDYTHGRRFDSFGNTLFLIRVHKSDGINREAGLGDGRSKKIPTIIIEIAFSPTAIAV